LIFGYGETIVRMGLEVSIPIPTVAWLKRVRISFGDSRA